MTTDNRDGATRIADERRRAIQEEGMTMEFDLEYEEGELMRAALCYMRETLDMDGIFDWPFAGEWWKPSADPVRNLEKAGQFIAAEIDRLLALRSDNDD